MNKKIPGALIASFLAFSLAACGGNNEAPAPEPMEDTVTTENVNPNTGTTEIQEENMETSSEALALAQEIVAKQYTVDQASKVLEENNYPWRISKINEADLVLTMDYMPNRFNFQVQGDDEDSYRIVKVTFG